MLNSVANLVTNPLCRKPGRRAGLLLALCVALSVSTNALHAAAQTPPAGMTQEQLDKALASRDDGLRKGLNNFGFKDKKLQDAVVAFANLRFVERLPLENQSANVLASLSYRRSPGDEITRQLASLRALAMGERERRATPDARAQLAQQCSDLDGRIGYSKNPRLEAFLTMDGLLGDEWEMVGRPPVQGAPGLGTPAVEGSVGGFDVGPNYPGTN